MPTCWRFYRDERHHWKWQRLSDDRQVIKESRGRFRNIPECMADAAAHGYVLSAPQPTRERGVYR